MDLLLALLAITMLFHNTGWLAVTVISCYVFPPLSMLPLPPSNLRPLHLSLTTSTKRSNPQLPP